MFANAHPCLLEVFKNDTPLKTNMIGKLPFWIGNTSSNGAFSGFHVHVSFPKKRTEIGGLLTSARSPREA